jgi:hypothetical protein
MDTVFLLLIISASSFPCFLDDDDDQARRNCEQIERALLIGRASSGDTKADMNTLDSLSLVWLATGNCIPASSAMFN